jgi:putative ABC transport system permease protein
LEPKNINQDYLYHEFVDKTFANLSKTAETKKTCFFILNLSDCDCYFGLFALASFLMERRLKEIAIRKTRKPIPY